MSDLYDLAYKSIEELEEFPAKQSGTIPVVKSGLMYKTAYNRFENTVVVKTAAEPQ